jgi:hypothetical protein
MRYTSRIIVSLFIIFLAVRSTEAGCGSRWDPSGEDSAGTQQCLSPGSSFVKRVFWSITWTDGQIEERYVLDSGVSRFYTEILQHCEACYPAFHPPYFDNEGPRTYFNQVTNKGKINDGNASCGTESVGWLHRFSHACPGQCLGQQDLINYPSIGCVTGLFFQGPCTRSEAFRSRCEGYIEEDCVCEGGGYMSPIVIDVDGSGFSMSDAPGGVVFNMLNDGVPLQLSWTAAGSTNAFLVLDRNGNGTIDVGQELFGDLAPQPASSKPNGFLALAEYDKAANGGNSDGKINAFDSIFSQLRLWQDVNHNGVSEPNELLTAGALGISAIGLDYKESKKTDAHGNQFRYRAKVYDVHGAQTDRWAWDVFLTVQ